MITVPCLNNNAERVYAVHLNSTAMTTYYKITLKALLNEYTQVGVNDLHKGGWGTAHTITRSDTVRCYASCRRLMWWAARASSLSWHETSSTRVVHINTVVHNVHDFRGPQQLMLHFSLAREIAGSPKCVHTLMTLSRASTRP